MFSVREILFFLKKCFGTDFFFSKDFFHNLKWFVSERSIYRQPLNVRTKSGIPMFFLRKILREKKARGKDLGGLTQQTTVI